MVMGGKPTHNSRGERIREKGSEKTAGTASRAVSAVVVSAGPDDVGQRGTPRDAGRVDGV